MSQADEKIMQVTSKGPGLYTVTSTTPYNRSMPS
jgi:hypothetical protein